MANNVSGEDFDVEERLFMALATGPLEKYKDLLNSLGDVDVQGVKQRTLLYVAVRLGKVNWVEGLLGKGANPGIRDADGKSVVELAQDMAGKYPEDGDRKLISKLVCLVKTARDSAVSVALGGNSNASDYSDNGLEATRPETMLSWDLASIRESLNDIQNRMEVNNIQMQEMATIQNAIITGMVSIKSLEEEMATIRNSLDEVKKALQARQGTGVTSSIPPSGA